MTANDTPPNPVIDFGAHFAAPAMPRDQAEAWVRARVQAAGTSFVWGLKLLSAPRRQAMFAVYAFCREIDDIADEPGPLDARRAALAEWRAEIARLYAGKAVTHPIALALAEPIRDFSLSQSEFLALIDGMEMDLLDALQGPDWPTLELYCRRVAGAVGVLTLEVLDERDANARELAVTLGEALQLTNILRDRTEDAARGRLYLPANLLQEAGIEDRSAAAVLRHPDLHKVCDSLAALALARFARSRELIRRCRRKPKTAIVMMEVYWRQLLRMQAAGWQVGGDSVKLSKGSKLWVALRYGLL
ncbi:presqualene diphosphate synthase HpnD [Algihabitans albus]|uniref:presqualene diphosphate synthase HpnD n=1 Tax=Algihabitans albus TaxID=2164067 RepID=UPI000E5D1795|nr:presqualene diphosphate synthase HpnD [Algihabitans albus]